jgi:hypothetical protein
VCLNVRPLLFSVFRWEAVVLCVCVCVCVCVCLGFQEYPHGRAVTSISLC